MKQKRSINEALSSAKKMRQALAEPPSVSAPQSEGRLKVVDQSDKKTPRKLVVENGRSVDKSTVASEEDFQQRPNWVRHTVGLHDATRLRLRDAADSQKKKDRHGTLRVGEPSNEQEIADLGIRLALEQLGYTDFS